MSTFMANKGNIVRKWYVLDAAGKPLGKTAAAAANLLRGKLKPEYTPHADCGDFVIISNAVQHPDAGAPRAGHEAGCPRHDASQCDQQGFHVPPEDLSRR